jgi:hypothetical protein
MQTDAWRLSRGCPQALYNDRVHGKNWANFFGRVTNQGPTVLLVEDEHGAVFGTPA